MKDWILAALTTMAVIIQLSAGITINYAPTEEQLRVLSFLGLRGYFSLWVLRIFSALILYFIFWVWRKVVSKEIFKWSLLILLFSPAFFALWYLFPLLSLKVLFTMVGFYLVSKNDFKKWWLVIFLIIGIVCYNRFGLKNSAAFFNKLSFKEAQKEVTARFISEDSLKSKIELPLWWRRTAYNKYFFVYKDVVAEVLPYFDLESLYFEEVSPIEQKSMVMFYWPEIFVLAAGIYFCGKNTKNNKLIGYLFLLSIFDFIFSEGAMDKRLLLTMWPLSIIMATAWVEMIKLNNNKYVLARWSMGIVGGLLLLAFSFNFYDLKVREEYWFDNRPLAFQFWYENLNKINLNDYEKIYVTSIIGDSKKYCYFYVGKKCDESKWVFDSFDLEKNAVEKKTIYAGFAGEFVGPEFRNEISKNWKNVAETKGLNFIGNKSLLNTIAYKYGDDIGVAIVK